MNYKFDKHKLFLLLIVVVGAGFRFYNLDKGGLWYDEIGTFSVAKESFPFGIINTLYHNDVHCPLFYFFLHFWMKIFGEQELVLRFFSAILGTANIIVFYLAGKALKSRTTGIITALLAMISPLLIYFSQEVRFYPLILLLMTSSLLFLIRFTSKPNTKNLIGLGISNLGIMYSYTIGLVFVFFEALIYAGFLIIKNYQENTLSNRENIKKFLISQAICVILFVPYLPMLFHHLEVSANSFLNFFDWGRFKVIDIFTAVQNWFSPYMFVYKHNYMDTHKDFTEIFGFKTYLVLFFLIAVIPMIIYITAIVRAIFRNKPVLVLFLIFMSFFSFEILMAVNERFILHGKYTVLNLPLIIIIAGYGFSEIKVKKPLLSYITVLSILYYLFIPFSAPHLKRSTAYKKIQKTFHGYNLTKQDKIILTHGSRYVKSYFPEFTSMVFPIDLEYVYFYRQNELLYQIFDKDFIDSVNKKNSRIKFKNFLSTEEPSKKFENYLKNELINQMQPGERLAIYVNRMTGKYKTDELKQLVKNEREYKEKSLARMLISKSSNDIIKTCKKYLKTIDVQKTPGKEIYLFRKQNLNNLNL